MEDTNTLGKAVLSREAATDLLQQGVESGRYATRDLSISCREIGIALFWITSNAVPEDFPLVEIMYGFQEAEGEHLRMLHNLREL